MTYNQLPGGPLGQLPQQVNSVLDAAGANRPRMSTAEAMVLGAVAGIAVDQTVKGMKRRKATKGEYTHPMARAWMLLFLPVILEVMPGWLVLPVGVAAPLFYICLIAGPVMFTAYMIYRATGHGRYNTRRKGSPWRDDHARGGAHRA